jgi:uncharacterized protein YndB with AHSA1/START domain
MNDMTTVDRYGAVPEPATVRIERLLPGPVERVWAYLTESDLRRRWLASGEMTLEPGAPFELVWRNDELTDPPGERPETMGGEIRMQSRIIEVDPPRLLSFAWWGEADVTLELAPRGDGTLLTITHRRLTDRSTLLGVSAGWHIHLDVLEARMQGAEPEAFWDGWRRLRAEYESRIPA